MRALTKTLMAVAVSAFLFTSCGGGSEVCQCADTMLSMMKEAKDVKDDKAKMEAIQEKYKAKMEKCQKLDEGKTEEQKKKMEEEMKACPAYQEVEKMMKESLGGN